MTLERARAVMAAGRAIAVLTGAGISTDSGIPDFRGPAGVWTRDPKAGRTASLGRYLEDAEVRRVAWRNRLESPVWAAEPNAGHLALVELERQGRLLALLTQNVDGLHQRAGNDPALVVELHGNMAHAVCWSCGQRSPMRSVLDRVVAGDPDPHCPTCGGILKSATVSFGQSLDPTDVARADAAAAGCDTFVAVGTTLSVHPAAGWLPVARRHGARVVIVNDQPTAYDHLADVVLRAPIGEVLPELVGLPAAPVDLAG